MPEDVKLPNWLLVLGIAIVRVSDHILGGCIVLLGLLQMPYIKQMISPKPYEYINLGVFCIFSMCVLASGGKGIVNLQKRLKNGNDQ